MRKEKAVFFAFGLIMLAVPIFNFAHASQSPNLFLGSGIMLSNIVTSWESIALIAALITISAAAVVFALASVINSPTARAWSRNQIYEVLLSLAMLLIFSAFAYLFLLNPVNAFSSIGLLPSQCGSANGVSDIFTLSACDLSTFNNYAFNSASTLYIASYVLGLAPGLSIKIAMPTQPTMSAELTLSSILPPNVENVLTISFNAIFFMLVLNQIQLLIISSAYLFLFIFFAVGIIARTFGFARSFGGVMIAFAIGLGLIYPILISISYGFIDTQVSSSSIGMIESVLLSLLLSPLALLDAQILTNIMVFVGYLAAGLTFIPFLNFLILDAFIVDFSSAIGERVSFMSLLTGLV
ncbi:MAG: hypothetical protein ACP5UC_01330 [Candidatus Micrarchaeia archaeon]